MVTHAGKTPAVPGFRMIAEMYPCIYVRLYIFSARIYGVYTRYMQTYMFFDTHIQKQRLNFLAYVCTAFLRRPK